MINKWQTNNNQQKKKKKTCKIVNFAVPADHLVKWKWNKKKNEYLDLAQELKKLLNKKVTFIPNVIDAFGTLIKGLIQGLEDLEIKGRVETIQASERVRTITFTFG